MKIQKTLYHSKLKQYLDQIHATKVDAFEIPFEIKAKQVSVFPYLLLVLMTAQRLHGVSRITITTLSDDEVHRFIDSFFGFTILSTFWKSTEFLFTSRKVLKSELYNKNREFHNKLINLSDLKMGNAFIPFFDHLPTHKGLSQLFYNDDNLKSEFELEGPLLAILRSISRNRKKEIYPHLSPVLESLMGLSWELLSNTHFHARTNEDDTRILSPNIRGLQCRILNMSYGTLVKYSEDDQALKNYYDSLLNANEIGLFFELTFFDSGPGIVKRFLGDEYSNELSPRDEAKALSKAMEKGNSSAVGHFKTNKGFGLDRVLQTLSKKQGFLKIRSGALNVYRDLIAMPYSAGTLLEDSSLVGSDQFKKESYLEGTLISLLIPISKVDG
jgi:hypothetical protein